MKGKLPTEIRVLDGEYCNKLWLELKTLNRVQARLTEEGIRSPRTGKMISRPAISMSAWRWSVKNPEASYAMEKKAREAEGIVLTRDMWNIELINHANQCLTAVGYRKWLKQFGLEDVARKFALSDS